jgi:hypothetical protein
LGSPAFAQHPAPAARAEPTAPPAIVPQPTSGRLSIDSTFIQLAEDPRTAAVMKKRMPGMVERLMEDEQVRAMMGGITVREMSIDQDHGKALTPQVLAMLDAEFAAAQAAPAPAAAPTPTVTPAAAPKSANLQGDGSEQKRWMNSPYWHQFFDLSKSALANGPAKVDMASYQTASMEIFGKFAESMHMSPAAMQDHLKLIPGQVVQIYKDDPHVLDSFDNFVTAMLGPD